MHSGIKSSLLLWKRNWPCRRVWRLERDVATTSCYRTRKSKSVGGRGGAEIVGKTIGTSPAATSKIDGVSGVTEPRTATHSSLEYPTMYYYCDESSKLRNASARMCHDVIAYIYICVIHIQMCRHYHRKRPPT